MPRIIDWGERLFLVLLFAGLAIRVAPSLPSSPFNVLILLSEGLIVVFILIRRATELVTFKAFDWLLALAATAAPMMVQTGGRPLVPTTLAAGLMLSGLLLSITSKLFLARSFGLAPANRGLKTRGPYAFIRHPMYLGYLLNHVGFILINPTWVNLIVYTVTWAIQIVRIEAEEQFLMQDPSYVAYCASVRVKLLPGIY